MTRADIKAELPGEQYTPSNGLKARCAEGVV